jgi:hypothetical protein
MTSPSLTCPSCGSERVQAGGTEEYEVFQCLVCRRWFDEIESELSWISSSRNRQRMRPDERERD